MKLFLVLAQVFLLSCHGGIPDPGIPVEYATGLVIPDNWEAEAVFEIPKLPTAYPDFFGYDNLPPMKNQGSCGSCWAFSGLAVAEFLKLGTTGEYTDYSEQHFVSSCSNSGSCSGGWMGSVFDAMMNGMPIESDDPYQARNTRCKEGTKKFKPISRWAFVGQKGREPTVDELKAALMTYGMLSVTIGGSGAIQGHRNTDKTFTNCNGNRINHMVNITSYRVVNGKTEFLVRNSWGSGWGNKGYAWMPAGCNRLASTAAFAVPNYDQSQPN